jgi:hypothetical protein
VWRTKWWALFAEGRADITWYSAGTDIVPWVPPWLYHAGKHIHVKTGMWNPVKNHLEGYDTIRRG